MITIENLLETNILRARRWHKAGINDWSALEWAGAMAGEAGEACNAAKKLKRIEDEIKNINEGDRSLTNTIIAKEQIAREVADTIIYGVLLAARVGFNGIGFEKLLEEVFNKKSIEYGFPERLG